MTWGSTENGEHTFTLSPDEVEALLCGKMVKKCTGDCYGEIEVELQLRRPTINPMGMNYQDWTKVVQALTKDDVSDLAFRVGANLEQWYLNLPDMPETRIFYYRPALPSRVYWIKKTAQEVGANIIIGDENSE
jgi:hypothetical protein